MKPLDVAIIYLSACLVSYKITKMAYCHDNDRGCADNVLAFPEKLAHDRAYSPLPKLLKTHHVIGNLDVVHEPRLGIHRRSDHCYKKHEHLTGHHELGPQIPIDAISWLQSQG